MKLVAEALSSFSSTPPARLDVRHKQDLRGGEEALFEHEGGSVLSSAPV